MASSHTGRLELPPLETTRTCRVFLSSADDGHARVVRDRLEDLVTRVFNPQLKDAQQDIRFEIDRWERTAAQRAPGGDPNLLFVQRAKLSHLTIVLLFDRVGKGTREELEAVRDQEGPDRPELAVLWFAGKKRLFKRRDPVEDFLYENRHAILYNRLTVPNSETAWFALVGLLFQAFLAAARQTSATPLFETR